MNRQIVTVMRIGEGEVGKGNKELKLFFCCSNLSFIFQSRPDLNGMYFICFLVEYTYICVCMYVCMIYRIAGLQKACAHVKAGTELLLCILHYFWEV